MQMFFKILFIFTSLTLAVMAETQENTSVVENMANAKLYATYPKPNLQGKDEATRQLIAKGEYLTKAGDCIACHTDVKNGGAPFAGGLAINTPFGVFYSPNITADKETGIGKWNDDHFIKAMREGLTPDGKNYFPVFPFLYFNKVKPEDLVAIKAYLFSIPAVKKENAGNELPFPLNWRFLQLGWKILFFQFHKGDFKEDTKKSAEWNRGAYLVEGLGHCGMCHTPLNILGAPKRAYYLSGGFIDGFWAPDISQLGLQDANVKEIVNVFKQSELINQAGKVAGPMADVNHNSLSYLNDADLTAIAVYLKSVKSRREDISKIVKGMQHSAVGEKVFEERCYACHGPDAGKKMGAPALGISNEPNWIERLRQGMPLLYERTIKGYNAMPVRGNCVTCTDADIRAAVDYLVSNSIRHESFRLLLQRPAKKLTVADGKKIYQQSCATCHAEGKNGAPKTGDKATWKPILATGFDAVLTNTLQGKNGMHKQGNCETCSKAEIIAAAKYMAEQSKTDGDFSLW